MNPNRVLNHQAPEFYRGKTLHTDDAGKTFVWHGGARYYYEAKPEELAPVVVDADAAAP